MPEYVDIERYVEDLRGFIAGSNLSEEGKAQTKNALDFFCGAHDFLKSVNHQMEFYEIEGSLSNAQYHAYYQAENQSISIGKRESLYTPDFKQHYRFDDIGVEAAMYEASTLAHEVLHAVDHYIYSQDATSLSAGEEFRYERCGSSHVLLETDRFLGRYQVDKDAWEAKIAGVFGVDVNGIYGANYKGRFAEEIVPRLVQDHIFKGGEELARIVGETTPHEKSLTHHIFQSYQDRLGELGEHNFLTVFKGMLGNMVLGMDGREMPQEREAVVQLDISNTVGAVNQTSDVVSYLLESIDFRNMASEQSDVALVTEVPGRGSRD